MARTNRYEVEFSGFPGNTLSSNSKRLLRLFCEGTQLPGISYGTTPSRTFGEERQFPYERIYENIMLTFYVDGDMRIKTIFDNWFAAIVDPETRTFNYYKNYIADLTIGVVSVQPEETLINNGVVVAEVDSIPYRVTLHEAYPKSMTPIMLEASSKDVMRLSVVFQYRWWTSSNSTTPVEEKSNRLAIDFSNPDQHTLIL